MRVHIYELCTGASQGLYGLHKILLGAPFVLHTGSVRVGVSAGCRLGVSNVGVGLLLWGVKLTG